MITTIVGASVIDGNGGPPIQDAALMIDGSRISALGSRASIKPPIGATVIDATGKFVTPGFIDCNVHITGDSFMEELFPLVLFGEANPIGKYGYALEAAQMALKFGVTTIRDTYGPLLPLLEVRSAIARGDVVGPRLQVSGDILGWGGPHHLSPIWRGDVTPMQEQFNDYMRAYTAVGMELTTMYPDEAGAAVGAYIDKGPDFIKIGVTSHLYLLPINMTFSPRVLRAMVDTAHSRGLNVDVHSSSMEGHLMAVEAGVDTITHAEMGVREFSEDLLGVLRKKGTVCAVFGAMEEGPIRELVAGRTRRNVELEEIRSRVASAFYPLRKRGRRLATSSAARLRAYLHGEDMYWEVNRKNAKRLIESGCTIAVATDSCPSMWPEIYERVDPFFPDMGVGTIIAIESLVGLGMRPGEALVAATKHGAMAAGKLGELGTLEVGKLADLLIFDANPLEDISNVRKLSKVVLDGKVVDTTRLPTEPKYYVR